ncbi:YcnI family protein [Actinosynnema pretiosum subsp. pretiosum]|uniref:Nuclear export factor GLE1 n=2 Tax=Actinosynnema TaxID=40566 RepID=C6WCJ5_ACTMD|nr:YcnI family protein [Actinosynnema mirum]ACU34016.1 nuclear export factor GLE1 [Actinosynnema mirum DSM 43827]AXX27408.1 Conserved membrane protein in copper uptake, YcnI [Actinosynnema pretiosum subsp. pretiosum]QUF01868.1 YcnI family protein [Actinosynnema pretiosum subsp. pretiosum]
MSTTRTGLRPLVRAGALLTTAGFLALGTAGTASAHVSASTTAPATQGGYAKVIFRVPNERPDSGTVKLEVTLPAEYPLASVSTKPLPGWQVEAVKATLDKPVTSHGREVTEAVRTVVWTADAGVQIAPGQFNEFEVSVGPLPDTTEQLVMPAKQTYASGEVVDWSAPPADEEPEHPAPVLKLVKPAEGADSHGNAPAGSGDSHSETAASTTTDDTARWLGGAGLAVGALGLGLGAGAVLRTRRSGKPSA